MNQLKIVEAKRDALLEPASEAAPTPAVMLARLNGIGSQVATVLRSEALYRHSTIGDRWPPTRVWRRHLGKAGQSTHSGS